jgi:hypothetical protein
MCRAYYNTYHLPDMYFDSSYHKIEGNSKLHSALIVALLALLIIYLS